jgi:hypothetical protein
MSTTSIDFVACKRRSKCLRSSEAFSFYLGNIQTNIRREQSTPNKQILGRVHYYDEDNVNDCGGWPRRLLEQSARIIVSFRNILFRHRVGRLLGKERHSPWTFCSQFGTYSPLSVLCPKGRVESGITNRTKMWIYIDDEDSWFGSFQFGLAPW